MSRAQSADALLYCWYLRSAIQCGAGFHPATMAPGLSKENTSAADRGSIVCSQLRYLPRRHVNARHIPAPLPPAHLGLFKQILFETDNIEKNRASPLLRCDTSQKRRQSATTRFCSRCGQRLVRNIQL
ncbi:hypothetical protein KCP75_05345 [Salmonella enterica subsp. enterica]|nr:hypothetical protein KCP75_05345 [Salmonella enterica subsp. enterica]